MPRTYLCYGATCRSEIPLVGFSETTAEEPDFEIRIGPVPGRLPDAREENRFWSAAPRSIVLHIDEAGRYLVRDGREIIVDPAPVATELDLSAFLATSALAALFHQRGRLVLHSGVIDTPKGALFFTGTSGVGKSTAAAALARRGYPVISDDLMVATQDAEGSFNVEPGPPSFRLWGDAAKELGFAGEDGVPVRSGIPKYVFASDNPVRQRRPVVAGFFLCPGAKATFGVTAMSRSAAFETYWSLCFRRRYAIAMGLRQQVFALTSRFAAQVPLFCLTRPAEPLCPDAVADLALTTGDYSLGAGALG